MPNTTSGLILDELKSRNTPAEVNDLLNSLPPRSDGKYHKYGTAARALRRMRSKGIVSSQRNGGRYVLWSIGNSPASAAKVPRSKPSSKGSSRSRFIMCRPDNMPTLCKAIEDKVASFIADKKAFSAFDVTKALREDVDSRAAAIDDTETGTVYVSGNSVAKVDHEIVKEAVHDIFSSGEMGDEYGRSHNGNYWEYAEMPDDPPDDDDSDDDNAPSATDGDDYDGSSSLGN